MRSSPQWNEILFVVIYDEHGGFYDHVPTPTVGVPSPDGIVGPEPYHFQFDRLGVRVPAVLISPWIEPGTVALPEAEKMRDSDANEEANITDFQEELVQLGAVLKGDHKESDYPDKLVENMKVNEAAEYCQVAFKKFCDDCEKAKNEGKDESYIVCDGEVSSGRKTSKTFADKLFSCLVCDN